MVPKMQYRSHNLVFQPDHLAIHIKISHKKETNVPDLYKCLTSNSMREREKKNIMHKTSSIYVALFKGHIYVFCTFAFYISPLNIPFPWLQRRRRQLMESQM